MQVGDLVTYAFQGVREQIGYVGLIVETGKWTGNTDVKVLWKGETKSETEASQYLTLVDNYLTT